jgi:hypothetical protein
MDPKKCWQSVDQIIAVMDQGFKYLATEEIGEQKTTQKDATFISKD